MKRSTFLCLCLSVLSCCRPAAAQEQEHQLRLTPNKDSIWRGEVGQGFAAGARELGVSGGAGFGMAVLGGVNRHDWWLTTADFGWMWGEVKGADRWYRGNWEILLGAFGGEQYRPDRAYLVGLAPHLRYDFATGTRVVPFIDAGAGVSLTDIKNGELSTTFEFNIQGGAGIHVFLTDHIALTGQYRFVHLSNAGIRYPNVGVNSSTLLAGLTWFF